MSSVVRGVLSLAITALAAATLYVGCWIPLQALRLQRTLYAATEQAEKLLAWNAPAVARDNLAQIERQRRWLPNDVQLALLAAANYRLLHRNAEAMEVLRNAIRSEQRPELYSDLALAELDAGQTALAEEHYAMAGAFNPIYLGDIPNPDVAAAVRKRLALRP